MRLITGSLCLCVFALLAAWPAAATVYVSKNGDGTTGDSWATAYFSIQQAVDDAKLTGEDVWISEGRYSLGTTITAAAGVSMYGGFPGTGAPSLADRDPNTFVTTLDGQNAAHNLISIQGANDVTVDGLRLTGAIGGGDGYGAGGAIIIGNSGSTGAIVVSNCLFEGNFVTRGYAGGLQAIKATVAVSHCVFRRNRAPTAGTGFHECTATVTDCIFQENVGQEGGGAAGYASRATFDRCLFLDNRARKGGGMCFHQGAEINVLNCLFVRNIATSYGGAIDIESQQGVNIANCTLCDNFAGENGGGIAFFRSAGGMRNCLFAGNNKQAIHDGDNGTKPTVANCLFHLNPDGVYRHHQLGVIQNVADLNALVANASGNLEAEPLFVNPAMDNFHLRPNSPAINAGTAVNAPPSDVDAEARPAGAALDIGYDEVLDTDGDGMPNWWESRHALSVSTNDAAGDPDHDTLKNSDEYLRGSDPGNPDSDDDGIFDNDETELGMVHERVLRDPIYVSKNGDNTTGASWATAFTDVAAGLAAARADAKDLWIAAGTYLLTEPLDVPNNTGIYGGFPATGTPTFRDRNPEVFTSVLDGGGAIGNLLHGTQAFNQRIDGLTITNAGNVTNGGGMLYEGNSISIVVANCIFRNNACGFEGGAMGLRYVNCFKVQNCVFENNNADEGGAIETWNSEVSVSDSQFIGNTGTRMGGAIAGYTSLLTIDRCAFLDNTSAEGAGVEAHEGAFLSLTNCEFHANNASSLGSAYASAWQHNITISGCTFVANVAHTKGCIYLRACKDPAITNSVFVDNRQQAIFEADDSADPIVRNCLFFNNPDGAYFDEGTILITEIGGPEGLNARVPQARANIAADPLFIDSASGDFHVRKDSPVVDAGTPIGAPATDIDGEPRPFDVAGYRGEGTANAHDIGADEYFDTDGDGLGDREERFYGTSPVVADMDHDGILDGAEVMFDGDHVYNPYHPLTNPTGTDLDATAFDTDGDGLSDGQEVNFRLNPLDPESVATIPATTLSGSVILVLALSLAARRRR